jgi:hypothetical protein
MVTLKQDMAYMTGELLEIATVMGRIGPEVESRFAELCAEVGFTPTVAFAATYFDYASGKVQLGDVISVTLTTEMILPGFGGFELPFDVSVTQSGLSRMYWK